MATRDIFIEVRVENSQKSVPATLENIKGIYVFHLFDSICRSAIIKSLGVPLRNDLVNVSEATFYESDGTTVLPTTSLIENRGSTFDNRIIIKFPRFEVAPAIPNPVQDNKRLKVDGKSQQIQKFQKLFQALFYATFSPNVMTEIVYSPQEMPSTYGLKVSSSKTLKIFERRCHEQFWNHVVADHINNGTEHREFIVRGTPGIGKSFFSHLLIVRLLKAGKKVVFLNKLMASLPNGIFIRYENNKIIVEEFYATCIAMDCVIVCDNIVPTNWIGSLALFIFGSPGLALEEFTVQSGINYQFYIFPLWSYEELKIFLSNFSHDPLDNKVVDDEFIKQYYERCGGVLRPFFDLSTSKSYDQVSSLNLDNLKDQLETLHGFVIESLKNNRKESIYDRFMVISAIDDTFDNKEKFLESNFQRSFCSLKIRDGIIDTIYKKDYTKMNEMLSKSPSEIQRSLLEGVANRYFRNQKGRTVLVSDLPISTKTSTPISTSNQNNNNNNTNSNSNSNSNVNANNNISSNSKKKTNTNSNNNSNNNSITPVPQPVQQQTAAQQPASTYTINIPKEFTINHHATVKDFVTWCKSNNKDLTQQSFYIIFTKSNNEALDSMLVTPSGWYLFQMTVADRHGLTYNGLKVVHDALNELHSNFKSSKKSKSKSNTFPTKIVFVMYDEAIGASGKHISVKQQIESIPGDASNYMKSWMESLHQGLLRIPSSS